MKILFVTQWFHPEGGFKGLPFAKALVERGHQVQVLTGFPNYPTGILYPGYRIRIFQKEIFNGVKVVRVPLYPSHDSSAVGRIANYLSFALSAAALGPWLTAKPDIVYVYHQPPTTNLPAVVIKLLKRVPVVYDIQDFWPDTLRATGMFDSRFGMELVDWYCRLFYRFADRIVVLSPGFKHKLIQKGVPESKIEVIYNWCADSDIAPVDPDPALAEELGMSGRFNVMFAGNMGKAQKLDSVLDAAKQVSQTNPKVQFVFIGGGVEVRNLMDRAAELDLSNVLFLPRRPRSEIGPVLALADVLLVHLKKDPLFDITIPSKIQGYMAAGKPILAAVAGNAAELVAMADCGLSCTPENSKELAATVDKFASMPRQQLKDMGENGRMFYQSRLSMNTGVSRFVNIFEEQFDIR